MLLYRVSRTYTYTVNITMKRKAVKKLSMRVRLIAASLLLPLALISAPLKALAQAEVIKTSDNLEVHGVPPIPAAISREVQPYMGVYGLPVAGWDATKREILLKGLSSVTWVSRVASPGVAPQTTAVYIQESGIYDVYFQPQARYIAYTRDANGGETFQLYLYNVGDRTSTLISDGKSRSTEPVWSRSGERIVYSSSPKNAQGVSLRLVNPFNPKSDRLLVQSSGSYLKAYDWSPDDELIAYCDFTSNTAGSLWLIDVATGAKTLLSPKATRPVLYDFPQFSKDGKGVYVLTDHDSDVRRVAYVKLATRQFKYLTDGIKWDVDEFQLAPDGRTLAFTTNEDGVSRLHILNTATNEEALTPQLPLGVISDLKWHNNSADLAFNFKNPRTPNDVYALDVRTGKVEVWSRSVTGGVDTSKFSLPEIIRWKTFDGRALSSYLYRPPAKFTGKRPVIIDIHGGPEEQYRPSFGYEHNYFLNELGVAKIYPNVRGSSGFGRSFLALDDGLKREDAVKDIGSLLDWVRTQPDLDAERVLVQGSSYGGYLALAAAAGYGDRVRAVISDSGISNLATFVERTEGWRRDLQRAEFGDERDPKTREFMERKAPLNNAQRIRRPLLIIQGLNDPRVPASEAERIVKATKDRVPVWYILAKDEGHGFVRQRNRDYRLFTSILFVKEFLLK